MKGLRQERVAGVTLAVVGRSIMAPLGPGQGAPGLAGHRLGLLPGLGALRLRPQMQGMPAKSAELKSK